MSGLLATTHRVSPARLRTAIGCLSFLGGDAGDVWSNGQVTIALTRKRWECDTDFSGGATIFQRDHLVVAADASIYDRASLVEALSAAGVRPEGSTATHLIAAAYRAWGDRLVDHLLGDFTFVIWDAARQHLIAGRDETGLRPLFYAELGTTAAVASSARAVAELFGHASMLNVAALGAQVAGLPWSAGKETTYEGVEALLPGHLLIIGGGRVRLERFWRPQIAPDHAPMRADDAHVQLRELISAAVTDRIGSGRATVWMSGGYDSTAVFAAGQSALSPPERARLRPVSISYPPNDPGREDELIDATAKYWGAKVQWLHSADIPLFDALEQRAAESDEPPAHLYELWNRALARATRATGARIALDGCGGDQLFQVSDIVLTDLLRAGQWMEALRLGRARGRGWRHFVKLGMLPLVPARIIDAMEHHISSKVPRHYLERRVAPWMRSDFVKRHALRERDLTLLRSIRTQSLAHTESMLYLMLPIWSWGAAYMRGPLLQEGIENRSPLLDRRVVEFALSRPIHERASTFDTKTLLRRSMQGLLPAHILDRRKYRTGTTLGFSRLRMREAYPGLVARMFARPLRLAELGIIDPEALRVAADHVVAGDCDEFLRVNLFHAMKVEFWLRGLDVRSAATAATHQAGSRVDFATTGRDLCGPDARESSC
jgi:asparagine synthase (glutamine-hydrolysing)